MECNCSKYDPEKIRCRIDNILKNETESSDLHYAKVCVLFVRIHNGDWEDNWRSSVFSRVYECFITECLNVISANKWCLNVYVASACVWGVYDGDTVEKRDSVVKTAAEVMKIVEFLNESFEAKGYSKVLMGLGIEYGEGLMVNSNYSSCIDDNIVWGGGNTRKAFKLCCLAGKDNFLPVAVGESFYKELSKDMKKLFNVNYCGKDRKIYCATLELLTKTE
ncbi:MAG: hypothetical protein Q4Q53_07160 [Methanocorpusculum sp.]|nr:hypothetical protein [Methanocorpusculum sp.]